MALRTLRYMCWGAVLPLLFACSETNPEQTAFIAGCMGNGDSEKRCSCTFDLLEEEVGDVDMATIDFISDLSSWNMAGRTEAMSRDEIIAKYNLTEEDYILLTQSVGHVLLKGFRDCPVE